MPKRKTKKKLSQRNKSYILMTISAICWGAAMIIVKPAFEFTTPYRFLLYRYSLASILSLPYLIYFIIKNMKHPTSAKYQSSKIKIKDFFTITWIELIGTTLALAMLYVGLSHTSAIEASLIATTTPIFVVIAGVIFLREKEEKHEIIGLSIAFIGTIMLVLLPLIQNNTGIETTSLFGNVLILAQNIIVAIYFILAKKYYQEMPKFFVASVGYLVGFFSFLVLSLIEISKISTNSISSNTFGDLTLTMKSHPSLVEELIIAIQNDLTHTPVLIASIYMAIFGSIIGYTAYIKGQEGIEASEASLFSYLQPLVYLPLGALWLGEVITTGQVASLGLILVGVVVVEKRSK